MFISFLLFIITILLVSIFWVLSMIHSHLKRDAQYRQAEKHERAKKNYGQPADF